MHKRILLALLVGGALACSNETPGPRGPAGEPGPVGPVGPQGERGEKGDKGEMGVAGPVGEQGPRGEAGPQGAQGETGLQGAQGSQGLPGLSADAVSVAEGDATCPFGGVEVTAASGDVYVCNGAPGAQGPQGVDGAAGPQGIAGEAGPQGPVGPVGPQGAAGESVAVGMLPPGDANCPRGGSQFTSASNTAFACNGVPGTPTPVAAVFDSTGRRVGDLLTFDFITWYSSILRIYTIVEEWSGRRVITRRRNGTEEMEIENRIVLFAELNCAGIPYSDLFGGDTLFHDYGGGDYYLSSDQPKQRATFLSTRTNGVCRNITPEEHEYYPAVQVAPPLPYTLPLVLRLN